MGALVRWALAAAVALALARKSDAAADLSLSSGEVLATVTYRSPYPGGPSGDALPVPQESDSGYFYFTSPENPEVFVKALRFDHTYAVFFSALTDYEVHVTFTVRATGQSLTFDKAAGPPISGFDGVTLLPASPPAPPAPPAARPAQSGSDLLLSSSRVRVRVTWKSQYSGDGGAAIAIPRQDDFGYFSFVDPANPEIFVKVLDFGRTYAVLCGGLTDFEFHVSVTVLDTGQVLRFDHPAGSKTGFGDSQTLLKGSGAAVGAGGRLAVGIWGGEHMEIDVEDSAIGFDTDCGHGTIAAPVTIEADGSFAAAGTYTAEKGGPIHDGDNASGVPALYAGRLAGGVLTVSVSLANGEPVGTFTVTHGKAGRVFKCQ